MTNPLFPPLYENTHFHLFCPGAHFACQSPSVYSATTTTTKKPLPSSAVLNARRHQRSLLNEVKIKRIRARDGNANARKSPTRVFGLPHTPKKRRHNALFPTTQLDTTAKFPPSFLLLSQRERERRERSNIRRGMGKRREKEFAK